MKQRKETTGCILSIVLSLVIALAPGIKAAEKSVTDDAKRGMIEAMYAEYKRGFPEVADISADEALKLSGRIWLVFVDVRYPEEQALSMLPGAITDKEFLKNPRAYEDYAIIGYCTMGYRSGKLAKKLKQKGYRMINSRGGILAWLHAGGKVYKDAKAVNRVHVYGKKWDLAPSDYEAVW